MVSPSSKKRVDGRLPNVLRPFHAQWDPMRFSLSSLILYMGDTAVLCSVSIEESVPKWLKGQGKGWLSAEYRLLPGSTPQRQSRELLKLSGRTQEIQRLIGRSLRASLDMGLLGERTLLIDCDVIQADAGTRTAAINGSWMVLQKGLQNLLLDGVINENPLTRQVAAVSVGLVDGMPLLDLNYQEDSRADVDLNVVLDQNFNFLEIQGTAEKKSFSRQQFYQLLDLAEQGIKTLHSNQLLVLDQKD